jgi:ribosomal protein L37AE/L43A
MNQQIGVLVKIYKGSEAEATQEFQADVEVMAGKGYFPTSQSYAAGSYGCATFVLALLLCVAVVGILILIYMMIVKPEGVLSVIYEFRGTVESRSKDEKTCPKCAERIKAAAQVCRFCGHQFDRLAMADDDKEKQENGQRIEAKKLAIRKTSLAYKLGKWLNKPLS